MVQSLPAAHSTALAARSTVAREFLWFTVKNRSTGLPVSEGIWSGIGSFTADVFNPDTQANESRPWIGAGTLVPMTPVSRVANLTVQEVTITLPHLDGILTDLVRTHDAKQGRVEFYRGMFNPTTNLMIAAAQPRFMGFISKVELITPKSGETGRAIISCKSHSQEFNRSNPDRRSDASQKLRDPTDEFYLGVETAGEAEIFWGSKDGKN